MAYSNMSALVYRFSNCFFFLQIFPTTSTDRIYQGSSKLQQRQIFSFVLSLATGLAYGYIFSENFSINLYSYFLAKKI